MSNLSRDPFELLFALSPLESLVRYSAPRTEIKQENDKTVIYIGLPGVQAEDLDIEVDQDRVSISVKEENAEDNLSWFAGHKQKFPLPKGVDTAQVTADLKDGLLTVVLPVSKDKQSRKVNVA